jgi:hypothetical protein
MGVVMKQGIAVGAALLLVGGLAPMVVPVGGGVAVAAGSAAMPFDFNGDGYADVAVGVPGEDLRGIEDAGTVQVMYGSAAGMTARDQVWHQGRRGVKGALERGDRFGTVVASGDFNSDGYADLAVGIPNESIRGRAQVGAVQVLYGSPRGLTALDQIWHQGKRGVPGKNEAGDMFGSALAVGDFDADGFVDLAVGVAGEDIGAVPDAGFVAVLRGSPSGLTSAGAGVVRQGRDGLPSQVSAYEEFGETLATGDVNGDTRDDLVVVVEFDADFLRPSYGDLDEAGSGVHVIFGSPTGLRPAGSQFFGPESLGFAEWSQVFSPMLADVNGDSRDDLAGVLWQSSTNDYRVVVLHGHTDGLHPAVLAAAGTPGVDGFWASPAGGGRLAVTDFNADSSVDLVLGALSSAELQVILGTGTGLGAAIVGSPSGVGGFTNVTALPLSGATQEWLVLGAPYAALSPAPGGSGMVGVLQGAADGTAGPVTLWNQDTPGIKGHAETNDNFGVF